MNKLTQEQIASYNIKRKEFDQSRDINTISPCVAPYNNMYFTTEGRVAPCWLLVGHLDTWGPDRSIKDIWFGEKFTEYRNEL